MNARTRLGLGVIFGAIALGVLADALFQGASPGLNVPLWAAAFTLVLAVLIRVGRVPWHQGRRWMLGPLLLFAGLFVWRDSELIVAANLVALAASVALGALRRPSQAPQSAGVTDYAGGLVAAGAATVAGPLPVFERDIAWAQISESVRGGRLLAAARGAAVGAPLVLLFGGLFVAADTVFKGYVTSALPTFPGTPIRIALVLAGSWLTAGLLRDLVAEREEARVLSPDALAAKLPRTRLGAVEVLIALGLLDLLFLAFVLVQFRYLFGGSDLVEQRGHLTYAEYARHGFFELVVASALTLPVLLLADWGLRRQRKRDELLFRVFAGTLVGLLLVVMASALERMRLYQSAYGLTELRIYATGLILWLAAVLVWFTVTVLFGRRRLFAVGAVAAGFAATLALNVLNPDALIVRVNLDRPRADVGYLTTLSDDAVPMLLRRLGSLDPPVRQRVARALLQRATEPVGWRSWTIARRDARALLARHRVELAAAATP